MHGQQNIKKNPQLWLTILFYFIWANKNLGCPINPLNAELNPTCHLLALLGAHHIFHVIGLRVKR